MKHHITIEEAAGYISKKFNQLTILEILKGTDNKQRILCRCECECWDGEHRQCIKPLISVISGSTKSCGCLRLKSVRDSKMIDLTGKTFGYLKVMYPTFDSGKNSCGSIVWHCKCLHCNNEVDINGANLRRGLTKSCGCLQKEIASKVHMRNIAGQKFGYLTAICPTNERKGSFVVWKCHCDYCGNDAYIPINQLMAGQASCGKCGYAANVTRERMTKWRNPIEIMLGRRFSKMISRCYNKNDQAYAAYGGRGIYICNEWAEDRTRFVKWALENGFKPGLTIDRINNDGPYAPWNCRWVTNQEQQRNKRTNHIISINGINMTLTDWAYCTGRSPQTLSLLGHESENDLIEYLQFVLSSMTTNELSEVNKKIAIITHGRFTDEQS